jgi:hypothetical protein
LYTGSNLKAIVKVRENVGNATITSGGGSVPGLATRF